MVFLRMGARFLFLRTDRMDELENFIINSLDGKIEEFEIAIDQSTEDSTIVFITDIHSEKTDVDDAKYIILVRQPSSIILSEILSSSLSGLIHRVDLGPASLIMRTAGNEDKVINRLKEAYKGEVVTWRQGVTKGEKMDTLVALTNQPLSARVSGEDFDKGILLLPIPVNKVQRNLRSEGIVFITQSMEEGQWYELRINIYDSKGYYSQHYKRLMLVLNSLELGMVLGERWTKDHALMLYSVVAYQVMLFTVLSPKKIKEILVGLEYNQSGERIADFDLYYRNKKVSWIDIKERSKKRNKVEEGKEYREILFKTLPETVVENLLSIENELV